jgi:hypothetical protein
MDMTAITLSEMGLLKKSGHGMQMKWHTPSTQQLALQPLETAKT